MSVKVVTTDKLEAHVLETLNKLLGNIDKNARSDWIEDGQNLHDVLCGELNALQMSMHADNESSASTDLATGSNIDDGKRYFASLIVEGVATTLELDSSLTDVLLHPSGTALNTAQHDSENIAAFGRSFSRPHFNTSGWDGRSWQSYAGQTNARTKHPYLQFLGNIKDVSSDLLEDAIKELLTKPALDFITTQIKNVTTFILGQEVVTFLVATAPHLLVLLGFVLLLLIKRSQSNDVNVPDDCACVWDRIRKIGETSEVVSPSDVIKTYREQSHQHPYPYNLAPCKQPNYDRIAKCPFRYPDAQGNDCCKLAYDSDDGFFGESRDHKILRTFYKLVDLGLLQTRIDRRVYEYVLA